MLPETVLCDLSQVSYAFYRIISAKTEVADAVNPTKMRKAVKNSAELAHMREVYLKDSAVLCKFIYWVKQNIGKIPMTEFTAAKQLDEMRSQIDGYLDLSFPTISAYGANAAMMHYEATEEKFTVLHPEGMLLVDSGGQYMGGTTDMTRTIVLGRVTKEQKEHFTAVAMGMLQLSDAKFLYGCTGRNLDILARQPIWDRDIDYKCGTGHDIGYILNVHETPPDFRWRCTANGTDAALEEGMVVSNEPGIYLDGRYGIRTENVMAVTQGKKNEYGQFMCFEPLTFVPIDLEVIDTAVMQPKDIERLNRYHALVREKIMPYLNEEEAKWLEEATKPIG